VGRKAVLIAFGVLGLVFTWPLFEALGRTRDEASAFVLVMALLAIISLYTAINAVVKAELFPAELRALGVALPLSFANALFGGTGPAVATFLKRQGHESWYFIYVAAMIGVSLAVFIRMRDTRRHSLIIED
jgi:MHS family alpha-ketoglutarate permease-like MFS transporter